MLKGKNSENRHFFTFLPIDFLKKSVKKYKNSKKYGYFPTSPPYQVFDFYQKMTKNDASPLRHRHIDKKY